MLKEKVLTTTGFYGTGSSAITDLIREYDNVCCSDDYEVRFLYDPYCISDLEYNIIDNPNRHNTGYAIKKFKTQMKMLDHVWFFKRYKKYFNGVFMPAIDKFCNSITTASYPAVWHYDVYDRGNLFYVISRIYSNINLKLHKLIGIPLNGRGLVSKKEVSYLTILDRKQFLNAVYELTATIIHSKNKYNKEFILLDQLVPPSNIKRYSRYIKDLKVIVVDRDPRDIYLLEKEVWRGTIAPTNNVEIFCDWYKWTRDLYYNEEKCKNCLNLKFEDLIYNYEETVDEVEIFFGLSPQKHKKKKEYFNPDISIKNTQLWKVYRGYDSDIRYIEKKLANYCYDFPIEKSINRSKNDKLF